MKENESTDKGTGADAGIDPFCKTEVREFAWRRSPCCYLNPRGSRAVAQNGHAATLRKKSNFYHWEKDALQLHTAQHCYNKNLYGCSKF